MEKELKNFGLIPALAPGNYPRTQQVFGTLTLGSIPDELDLGDVVGPVDQGATQFCAEYTTRELCSDIDQTPYSVDWNVAITGKIAGAPITIGTDPHVAMEAMIVYGPLPQSDAPESMTWQERGADFIANWINWPQELFMKAAPHEQSGYSPHIIDGPYDAFDNLRAQILLHKRTAALATQWFGEFNTPTPSGSMPPVVNKDRFSWHMYTAKGWKVVDGEVRIKIKPYEGAGYGVGGYSYLSRDEINMLEARPEAHFLMFADTSMRSRKDSFLHAFINMFKRFFNI